MSEEPAAPADEEKPQQGPMAPVKKRERAGPKVLAALLIAIEENNSRPLKDGRLKEIAISTGTNYGYFRLMWSRYKRGLVDIGLPENETARAIDIKFETIRTLDMIARTERFLNDLFGKQILMAEELAAAGEPEAFEKSGIPRTLGNMKKLMDVRRMKENGYHAAAEQARQRHTEKEVKAVELPGAPPAPAPPPVARANELMALREMFPATKPEVLDIETEVQPVAAS